MLNKHETRIEELRKCFNKEIENVIKNHSWSETKNTITKIKKISEGTGSRLINREEWIRKLEEKIVEITQSEQQNEWKEFFKMRTV